VGIADARTVRAALTALLADRNGKNKVYALALRFGRTKERADELLQTACVKLLSGKRTWDPEQTPDLADAVGGVMASLSSHEYTAAPRLEKLQDDPDVELHAPDRGGDAETRNLQESAERRVERRLERWMGSLRADRAGDAEALRLLDCFSRGVVKAAEQVAETGWRLNDVRRVRRRVFDRAEIVMQRHPDDSGAFAVEEAS
jgi:hypothetical protein